MQSIGETFSGTYRAEPGSISVARRALSDFASAAGADARQVEAVRLASSEALTNSVLHAYRGEPGNVYVTAAIAAGELWVLIADDGCGLEPQADRPGLGLGLGLISQVSDDLAIVPRAAGGIEVRMRFNLVSAKLAAAPDSIAGESSSGAGPIGRESSGGQERGPGDCARGAEPRAPETLTRQPPARASLVL